MFFAEMVFVRFIFVTAAESFRFSKGIQFPAGYAAPGRFFNRLDFPGDV